MSTKPSEKPIAPVVVDTRCRYVGASGRRCRSLAARDTSRSSGFSAFCLSHALMEQQYLNSESVAKEMIGRVDDFRTYHAVNEVLGKLLILVAENRIPLRNANSLSYICQLLLASAPGVRYELNLQGGEDEELHVIKRTTNLMYGTPKQEEDDEDEEDGEEEDNKAVQQPVQTKPAPINSVEELIAAGVKLLDGK
jgi:hypothetical protein